MEASHFTVSNPAVESPRLPYNETLLRPQRHFQQFLLLCTVIAVMVAGVYVSAKLELNAVTTLSDKPEVFRLISLTQKGDQLVADLQGISSPLILTNQDAGAVFEGWERIKLGKALVLQVVECTQENRPTQPRWTEYRGLPDRLRDLRK